MIGMPQHLRLCTKLRINRFHAWFARNPCIKA